MRAYIHILPWICDYSRHLVLHVHTHIHPAQYINTKRRTWRLATSQSDQSCRSAESEPVGSLPPGNTMASGQTISKHSRRSATSLRLAYAHSLNNSASKHNAASQGCVCNCGHGDCAACVGVCCGRAVEKHHLLRSDASRACVSEHVNCEESGSRGVSEPVPRSMYEGHMVFPLSGWRPEAAEYYEVGSRSA